MAASEKMTEKELEKYIAKYIRINFPEIKNCPDNEHAWAKSFISEINSTIYNHICIWAHKNENKKS